MTIKKNYDLIDDSLEEQKNKEFYQNIATSYTFHSGINLNIMDFTVKEKKPSFYKSKVPMAELHYCLLGSVEANLNGQLLHITNNQWLLSYMPYVQMETEYQPNQTLKCISIAFTEQSYNQIIAARFPTYPLGFRQMLGNRLFNYINRPFAPQILVLLKQLLHCPYHEALKSIYVESKMLELIAASIELIVLEDMPKTERMVLREEDIQKIRYAKEIMEAQMANPPSLLALAKLVGMNDNKLKYGFKEVYGTTVFAYLRQYRMDVAYELLCKGQTNVSETAWAVGYNNLSHFAEVFRTFYGVNPSEIRKGTLVTSSSPSIIR